MCKILHAFLKSFLINHSHFLACVDAEDIIAEYLQNAKCNFPRSHHVGHQPVFYIAELEKNWKISPSLTAMTYREHKYDFWNRGKTDTQMALYKSMHIGIHNVVSYNVAMD